MTEQEIKICETNIADALNSCANVLVCGDADGWSYYMNFSEATVFNAILVLNSIISNYSIKHGHIKNFQDAEDIGCEFREVIKKMFGVDTFALANKQ